MLHQLKSEFENIIKEHNLMDNRIEITARPLEIREAIGETGRTNLPLQTGKEVLIQAEFSGCSGQAFTDNPGDFTGTLDDVLKLELDNNFNRALLVAAINAVTCYLGLASNTIHCRDDDLEKCGNDIVKQLKNEYGEELKIGIIGFQPVIIENIISGFGQENVAITDLSSDNIGTSISGVGIWDGTSYTEKLIAESDVVLATGSTAANDSLMEIKNLSDKYSKELLLFGTTVAGPAALLGLKRICPRSY